MSSALRHNVASEWEEKPRTVPLHDSLEDAEPRSCSSRPGTERRRPSLSEFAEQFETVMNERQDLTSRLNKALDDITAMTQLHKRDHAEFDCERTRLNSEIARLRAQLTRSLSPSGDEGRFQSLLGARERLIRDEFEKKFQELTLEVKRERNRYTQEVQKVKQQMATCICRASGG